MATEINQEKSASASAPHHVEHGPNELNHFKDVAIDDKVLNQDAKEATATEHSYGFVQGIKTYRRAAIWSICK